MTYHLIHPEDIAPDCPVCADPLTVPEDPIRYTPAERRVSRIPVVGWMLALLLWLRRNPRRKA